MTSPPAQDGDSHSYMDVEKHPYPNLRPSRTLTVGRLFVTLIVAIVLLSSAGLARTTLVNASSASPPFLPVHDALIKRDGQGIPPSHITRVSSRDPGRVFPPGQLAFLSPTDNIILTYNPPPHATSCVLGSTVSLPFSVRPSLLRSSPSTNLMSWYTRPLVYAQLALLSVAGDTTTPFPCREGNEVVVELEIKPGTTIPACDEYEYDSDEDEDDEEDEEYEDEYEKRQCIPTMEYLEAENIGIHLFPL